MWVMKYDLRQERPDWTAVLVTSAYLEAGSSPHDITEARLGSSQHADSIKLLRNLWLV